MKNLSAKLFRLKAGLLIVACAVITFSCSSPSDNEVSAIQSIIMIRNLQKKYAEKHQGKFGPDFDELVKTETLDKRLGGEKPNIYGYVFEMKILEPTNQKPAFYSITADPLVSKGFNKTGTRHFYYDSTLATIKATEENRQAKADDPSI